MADNGLLTAIDRNSLYLPLARPDCDLQIAAASLQHDLFNPTFARLESMLVGARPKNEPLKVAEAVIKDAQDFACHGLGLLIRRFGRNIRAAFASRRRVHRVGIAAEIANTIAHLIHKALPDLEPAIAGG